MPPREVAYRVFAAELLASLEEDRPPGDRVAAYLLSPYGSRMSRVLVAGELTPAETSGEDGNAPWLRSRLTDPTGTITVTAGVYQPRALAQLRAISTGTLALVVGRTHLYRGRDGVGYVSVRAEGLRPIDPARYHLHLIETAEQTLDRLDRLRELENSGSAGEAGSAPELTAARAILARYPNVDREAYRRSLRAVLEAVARPGREGSVAAANPPPALRDRVARSPDLDRHGPDPATEGLVLAILDEIAEGSVDGYADAKELFARLAERGIPAARAESLLERLEGAGSVEEPLVGKFRRP